MNANELAEIIEHLENARYTGASKAATMLRQQADLIRNLQKSLGFKNSGYETINLTPQLELTDEEILEVAKKMGWRGALGFLINFARAILRKAQEK